MLPVEKKTKKTLMPLDHTWSLPQFILTAYLLLPHLAISKAWRWTPGWALAAASTQPHFNPFSIYVDFVSKRVGVRFDDSCKTSVQTSDDTVCALLLHQVQFVIIEDGGDLLGSRKLYYCKCSCVYILEGGGDLQWHVLCGLYII